MKITECYRSAYRAAIKAGWTVARTGSGHLRWQPPDDTIAAVITPATGHRHGGGSRRDLSRLRRAGLKIGP